MFSMHRDTIVERKGDAKTVVVSLLRMGIRIADLTQRDPAAKLPPRATPTSQLPGRKNADRSAAISCAFALPLRRLRSHVPPVIHNHVGKTPPVRAGQVMCG